MVIKNEYDETFADIDPEMEKAFAAENRNPAFGSHTHGYDDSSIAEIQFPHLQAEDSDKKIEKDVFSNIPIKLSVELGRSQISLKEVFELTEGSIIELERLVGEPLDLVVNGQIIAQGEVVAIDNNYGFRVTGILSSIKKE